MTVESTGMPMEAPVLAPAAQRSAAPRPRLRVAVLVDLALTAQAGGHVKSWERLAQAALGFAEELDLTVHFVGEEQKVIPLGENVRYVLERPVFSTARLGFLAHVPDHTDLAPWHPRLGRALQGYDVIHTTDAYFAYARTAMRFAQRRRIPLVNSVHTNTPEYARIFASLLIERLCGPGALARAIIDHAGVPRRIEARMLRRLAAYQRRCAAVFVSRPEQLGAALGRTGGRATLLRRGVDRRFFSPQKRDRAWLRSTFGIPRESPVLLFVGRINHGKNVALLLEAMTSLAARGVRAHLVCAGDGEQRALLASRLGDKARCPGNVDPESLARLYASADIFVFPSQVEEYANVVLEALASGLPVIAAEESGMGRVIRDGETGYALPGDQAGLWAEQIATLLAHNGLRSDMARAARHYTEREIPSWAEVLGVLLLPEWRRAAVEAAARA